MASSHRRLATEAAGLAFALRSDPPYRLVSGRPFSGEEEMTEAVITEGLLDLRLDKTKYYAVLTFETGDEPLVVALPTEAIAALVERALAAKPHAASTGETTEVSQAFVVSGANVNHVNEDQTLLQLRFGRGAEIRFLFHALDSHALGQALQRAHLKDPS